MDPEDVKKAREKERIDEAALRELHANDPVEVMYVSARRGSAGDPTLIVGGSAATSAGPGGTAADDGVRGPGLPGPATARYEVLGTVGRGGMGLVFLARDLDLRRKVALKQLTPEIARDDDAVGRFVKEVQITAQLDHPHIVPVYGLEVTASGALGYAMKLVQGKTFVQLIEETRAFHSSGTAPDEAHGLPARLEHFLKVCDAVAYAHGKGVLHRDLKPANLMLGRYNEVYVMDWGLARLLSEAPGDESHVNVGSVAAGISGAGQTELGSVVGTPRYMSPEQARGKSLDARSDQYALGLILFELVTLERAVDGQTLEEVMRNMAAGRKRPLASAPGGAPIPASLAAIIEKATARDPGKRYARVAELAADLRRFLRDEPILARPDTRLERLLRVMSRHRRTTFLVVAGLVAVCTLGVLFHLYQEQLALNAAQRRERKIGDLLTLVSKQGDAIEVHFLQLQGLLEGLTGAAVQALTEGRPTEDRFYWIEDFKDPARRPPDLAFAPRYNGKVSAAWPVWALAPGVSEAEALPQVRRLATLRQARRRMFVESEKSEGESEPGALPTHATLERKEIPVIWSYIGLAGGIATVYPGTDAIPSGYDPRVRPWYLLSAEKRGPRWGNPHLDQLGTGLVLPCSMAMYDETDRLLGVAGLNLTFDHVINALLRASEVPAGEEAFLLDKEGRILVRSNGALARAASGPPAGPLQLETFPFPPVVRSVLAEESGYREVERAGRPLIVAYERLASVGLTYAVVVDSTRLLEAPRKAAGRR